MRIQIRDVPLSLLGNLLRPSHGLLSFEVPLQMWVSMSVVVLILCNLDRFTTLAHFQLSSILFDGHILNDEVLLGRAGVKSSKRFFISWRHYYRRRQSRLVSWHLTVIGRWGANVLLL